MLLLQLIDWRLEDIAVHVILWTFISDGKVRTKNELFVYDIFKLNATVRDVVAEFYVLLGDRDSVLNWVGWDTEYRMPEFA